MEYVSDVDDFINDEIEEVEEIPEEKLEPKKRKKKKVKKNVTDLTSQGLDQKNEMIYIRMGELKCMRFFFF